VVADVLVDGGSVGVVTSYTFANVTADHTIAVSFAPITYALTVNVDGPGAVIVDPDQATFDCGATVELTAVPDSGAVFAGWSGDVTSTGDSLIVVMDADKTITATFIGGASLTSVAENLLGPGQSMGVYPNPSRTGGTHVLYRAPARGAVSISVFDVSGRVVKKLAAGGAASGVRAVTWDGRDESGRAVSAGTYFVRMTTSAGATSVKRLVVLR
jgi:hypothetical protein